MQILVIWGKTKLIFYILTPLPPIQKTFMRDWDAECLNNRMRGRFFGRILDADTTLQKNLNVKVEIGAEKIRRYER